MKWMECKVGGQRGLGRRGVREKLMLFSKIQPVLCYFKVEYILNRMAYLCPSEMWFAGAEEAVNTLVSDNCERAENAKTIIHQIKISI